MLIVRLFVPGRCGIDVTADDSMARRALRRCFELIATVGTGGFGTVYKALDPQLDRIVALKVLRLGDLASDDHKDRFLREARNAAQLRHPAIVQVHEIGDEAGVPFIVSDYIEGVTLSDWLTGRRPPYRESAHWSLSSPVPWITHTMRA